MRRDWVYEDGALWSKLVLIGSAFIECWDGCPRDVPQWDGLEVRAWMNLNAFTARMCQDGVAHFWSFWLWPMGNIRDIKWMSGWGGTTVLQKMSCEVTVAATWILMASTKAFNLVRFGREEEGGEDLPEWLDGLVRESFTMDAWLAWNKAIISMSTLEQLDEDVRQIASDAAQEIEAIENNIEWTVL